MDINKLIEFYDKEQKLLFTSFCVTIPLSFSILYLYIPEFKLLDIYSIYIFGYSFNYSYNYIFYSNLIWNFYIKSRKNYKIIYNHITCNIYDNDKLHCQILFQHRNMVSNYIIFLFICVFNIIFSFVFLYDKTHTY